MPQKFFITTPMYYVNDRPHIGHTYTTILADVMARNRRMLGDDVFFLTGADEHGQKIEKAAALMGLSPQQLADVMAPNFENLWKDMGLTHDRFVRTTERAHKEMVTRRFSELSAKGDIYKAEYEGLYSVSDEAFVTETQAKDLQAQGLGHTLTTLKEESYFFKLSAYENWLLQLYDRFPEFVAPDFRLNEVRQFVAPNGERGRLQDLSISRSSISWGIRVPGDTGHVVYVWFDALLSYMSACREGHWPPQVQVVGKDILRFHAVYWPAFLMAIFREEGDSLEGDLPERVRRQLPGTILAHGWWLMGDMKMSKSLGNIVRPKELLHFGRDAARYFLLRDMQMGHDRTFAFEGYIERLNADLANGLGNLASRSISMLHRYRQGHVPIPTAWDEDDRAVRSLVADTVSKYMELMGRHNFCGALECLWGMLRGLDGYIVKSQPWNLAKEPAGAAKLNTVMAQLNRALRLTAVLAAPVMPEICQLLWISLGLPGRVEDQRLTGQEALGIEDPAPGPIGEAVQLFARIVKEQAMAELGEMQRPPRQGGQSKPDVPELRETTDYDTFCKTDLRVGRILEAERVPKSEKLIRMKVDIGLETRTIVGGIGKAYEPRELVGRKVVVVANLAPRKLMGVESHGMLLCASDNASKPFLITPADDALPGFVVK